MNKLSIFVGISAFVLSIAGCGGPEKVYSTQPLQASSASFTAYGMGCPKCANNITLLLEGVVGVENVRVNMGTGVIVVDLVGDLHPAEVDLATAVEEAGFTYKGMNE